MSQSKKGTLIETAVSLAVGMALSVTVSVFLYPMFGHAFTLAQNFWITVIFTIISFIRSYVMRRFFNYLQDKNILV